MPSRWHDWKTRVDFDAIDYPSLQLIPQVYRRLKTIVPHEPLLPKMRGIYKKMWFANQMLFNNTIPAMETLNANGIDWMAIKGVGMLRYYPGDVGLRPMHDFDILINKHDLEQAVDLLIADGWRATPPLGRNAIRLGTHSEHALSLARTTTCIDIHWHSLHQDLSADSESDIWKYRQPDRLIDRNIEVPAPTEQLFLMCIHGVRWEDTAKLLWVVDAAMLLEQAGDEIDWDRLLDHAVRRHFACVLASGFTFLRDDLDIHTPAYVLNRLQTRRAMTFDSFISEPLEHLELEALSRHPGVRTRSQRFASDAMRHWRSAGLPSNPWQALKHWVMITPDDPKPIEAGLRALLRISIKWWPLKHALGSRYQGLFLRRPPTFIKAPLVRPGEVVHFTKTGIGSELAIEGWSAAEPDFTWSESCHARLLFKLEDDPLACHQVKFFAGAYLPPGIRHVSADILINGVPMARWRFGRDLAHGMERQMSLPAQLQGAKPSQTGSLIDIVVQNAKLYCPAQHENSSDHRFLGLKLYWMHVERNQTISIDDPIDFTSKGEGKHHLGSGWSNPEPAGTWTVDERARLRLTLDRSFGPTIAVELTLTPFAPSGHTQMITLVAASTRRRFTFDLHQLETIVVPIDNPASGTDNEIDIEFRIAEPISPLECGLSTDERRLGLMLNRLRLIDPT